MGDRLAVVEPQLSIKTVHLSARTAAQLMCVVVVRQITAWRSALNLLDVRC
jgi:hypothetical protein